MAGACRDVMKGEEPKVPRLSAVTPDEDFCSGVVSSGRVMMVMPAYVICYDGGVW